MAFKEVDIKSLNFNPFTKIGSEWMLITAGDESGCNTMTASWGGLGVLWGKNVATCYIRREEIRGRKRYLYPVLLRTGVQAGTLHLRFQVRPRLRLDLPVFHRPNLLSEGRHGLLDLPRTLFKSSCKGIIEPGSSCKQEALQPIWMRSIVANENFIFWFSCELKALFLCRDHKVLYNRTCAILSHCNRY